MNRCWYFREHLNYWCCVTLYKYNSLVYLLAWFSLYMSTDLLPLYSILKERMLRSPLFFQSYFTYCLALRLSILKFILDNYLLP